MSNKIRQPESQIQEVLYELLTKVEIDRRSVMFTLNIWNLPARICNLRHRGVVIESRVFKGVNKYGNNISFVHYRLKNRAQALSIYKTLFYD